MVSPSYALFMAEMRTCASELGFSLDRESGVMGCFKDPQ